MSIFCSTFAPVFNFCTMQKHIYLLSLSVAVLCLLSANVFAKSVTPAANIPSYWSSVDGKSGAELWKAISAQTNAGFSSIGYKGLYSAYLKTDVYPTDSASRAGKIWDMYGECNFAPTKTCGNYSSVCDCYNREHSIPQSWFGGGTSGIGCDIFHVLPTDGKVNGVRSNYEYGEVNGGTNWVGNKFGSAGSWSTDKKTIASAAGESVSGTGQVFEPKPQYKGDIARGIMGTIIKWQHSSLTSGNNFFNSTYTVSGNFGLTKKAVVLLMKWHREDPVSRKEIDRNNGIQETQGNRNPFIDYPYLAEYIWGEKAGETVDMSKLMASCDPAFVPGKSNGWRDGSGPDDPTALFFGVTWSVNGEELQVDSVAEANHIFALPDAPVSCSSESPVFMGWTDAPIEGRCSIPLSVSSLPSWQTSLIMRSLPTQEKVRLNPLPIPIAPTTRLPIGPIQRPTKVRTGCSIAAKNSSLRKWISRDSVLSRPNSAPLVVRNMTSSTLLPVTPGLVRLL